MGQDKKHLALLLEFVEKVYGNPLNREFIDGVRRLVLNDKDFMKGVLESMASPESLNRIESYLSLDFQTDGMDMPDYSFIVDDSVKNRLTVDFREMLRYRFGTRNHKIDFPEFCRYATLQIEMLVNYYYDKKFDSDFDLIDKAIIDGNTVTDENGNIKCFYSRPSNASNVSDIGLKFKIQALQNQFGWKFRDITPYLNAVDVRNRQSHRSLRLERDIIKDTEEKLKNAGIMKRGNIDFISAKRFLGTKLWNEYSFQKWFDEQPFDSLISSVSRLCSTINSRLV